jgi:ABC-type transport system involved in cytochrome c biogenesis permease component
MVLRDGGIVLLAVILVPLLIPIVIALVTSNANP